MLPVTRRPVIKNKVFEIDRILEGDKWTDKPILIYPAFIDNTLTLDWFSN